MSVRASVLHLFEKAGTLASLVAKVGTLAGLGLILAHSPVLAQIARHPFAIGANEGAVGHQSGLGAWILGHESAFYRLLTGAVRATRDSSGAMLGLVGISFAYGVFHAAGPGHGKAVIAVSQPFFKHALPQDLSASPLFSSTRQRRA